VFWPGDVAHAFFFNPQASGRATAIDTRRPRRDSAGPSAGFDATIDALWIDES